MDNGHEFDIEQQCRVRADGATRSSLGAVRQIAGYPEAEFTADRNRGDAFGPDWNHLIQTEFGWTAPTVGTLQEQACQDSYL